MYISLTFRHGVLLRKITKRKCQGYGVLAGEHVQPMRKVTFNKLADKPLQRQIGRKEVIFYSRRKLQAAEARGWSSVSIKKVCKEGKSESVI